MAVKSASEIISQLKNIFQKRKIHYHSFSYLTPDPIRKSMTLSGIQISKLAEWIRSTGRRHPDAEIGSNRAIVSARRTGESKQSFFSSLLIFSIPTLPPRTAQPVFTIGMSYDAFCKLYVPFEALFLSNFILEFEVPKNPCSWPRLPNFTRSQ